LGIEIPIVQAPMAGSSDATLVAAVCETGALGSLACGVLAPEAIRDQVGAIRARTADPFNLNFFCHAEPPTDVAGVDGWARRLEPYRAELGVEWEPTTSAGGRLAFDDAMCEVVEELRPAVVSFHFGLPRAPLVERVRSAGATVVSSATTVAEARWLEDNGCQAVIAQGIEAGGHRAMFLATDLASQVGTMALVPQVVDAVDIPVIAAGGIGDSRGIVAALALGADGVQLGTAFLLCPEATTGTLHREALRHATDDATAVTNVLTGRPARSLVNRVIAELGPMAPDAPAFPLAAYQLAALRASAEAAGSDDFSSLWSGQAAPLAREVPAAELVRTLAAEIEERHAAGRAEPDRGEGTR
jgi:nitronate monooxygenase